MKNETPMTKFLIAILGIALAVVLGFMYQDKISAALLHSTGTLQMDANNREVQSPPGFSLIDGSALSGTISNLALTGNVVTVTTSNTHGYKVGEQVTVALLTGPTLFADCNGSFIIATVGATTFTYAFVHADITTGAATGTALAYMCSPMPTATTTLALVFPPKAVHLVVMPTTATDAVFSKTSTGTITQTGTYTNGGNFSLTSGTANHINGVEGDTVYIIRTTTTPIYFAFDSLR